MWHFLHSLGRKLSKHLNIHEGGIEISLKGLLCGVKT